jgi:SAM-dependent MidA family methyltransferase
LPENTPAAPALEQRLARLIARSGAIPVEHYMAEANAHYYATRDPLGAAGDFITAPEISQMFGELAGLWLADLWARAGRPANAHYVELGPGRGTLARDALKAMKAAGLTPPIALVETSPVLRAAQAALLPAARWHRDCADLPEDGPLLIVANEFFDALSVRQLVATGDGWHERMVAYRDGRFVPVVGPAASAAAIPDMLRDAPPGTIVETSPASAEIAGTLATRIAVQGGAALIIDYGHNRSSPGETLQAVHAHGYADPWAAPGERDLTAHVDFETLARAARRAGAKTFGPVEQGDWLRALGIDVRAATLAAAAPARAEEIEQARFRLTAPDEMGQLFKVLALVAPSWPDPEGFR